MYAGNLAVVYTHTGTLVGPPVSITPTSADESDIQDVLAPDLMPIHGRYALLVHNGTALPAIVRMYNKESADYYEHASTEVPAGKRVSVNVEGWLVTGVGGVSVQTQGADQGSVNVMVRRL